MVEPAHMIEGTRQTESKRPVVYTQPDCPGCDNVKRFLNTEGVGFSERDISSDHGALREFEQLGRPATPVTVIDETVIWGFNRRALSRALGLGEQL